MSAGGLLGDQPEGRSGGGPGDVGRVRAGVGGEPRRPARAGAQWALPGEAIEAGVYPEGGWAATAARYQFGGGQDPATGCRRGAGRRLRGVLPGSHIRVPSGYWDDLTV